MSSKFGKIGITAVLVEALITYVNQFFMQGFCWEMATSITLGIIIAIAYKIDIPAHFEVVSKIPYVGCIISGILISRGSNYIFDLLNGLSL